MDRQNITTAKLAEDIRKAQALVDRAIALTCKGQLIDLCSMRSHIEKICRNVRHIKDVHTDDVGNLLFALDEKLCDFNIKLCEQFDWLDEYTATHHTAQVQEES